LLRYLVAADPATGGEAARRQYAQADNMTDRMAALAALLIAEPDLRDPALGDFATRFAEEPLILDMWFGLQARIGGADAVARIRALTRHPHFTIANPNRVRALVGTFANANPRGFHAPDGAGYRLVAEIIAALDQRNPQVAARLATAFRTWRSLEPGRRAQAEAALRSLAEGTARSRDLGDILERTLS
ncbi:MAG: aminopeptidase N C-terminal domain-containing protein, partial [Hyphomicrobiales bacterium]|nr:aminopeptidase N C-terminal domain-containing protein [Hyphomicrobiales bacterium]